MKTVSETTMMFRKLKDNCIRCGYWQGNRQMFRGTYLGKYQGKLCSKCVMGTPISVKSPEIEIGWRS